METIAFRMALKPGMRDEYERRHRELWPELADALRRAGIRDYWIFLDEATGQLFATLKREPDHQMDALPLVIPRNLGAHLAHTFLNRAAPQQYFQVLLSVMTMHWKLPPPGRTGFSLPSLIFAAAAKI